MPCPPPCCSPHPLPVHTAPPALRMATTPGARHTNCEFQTPATPADTKKLATQPCTPPPDTVALTLFLYPAFLRGPVCMNLSVPPSPSVCALGLRTVPYTWYRLMVTAPIPSSDSTEVRRYGVRYGLQLSRPYKDGHCTAYMACTAARSRLRHNVALAREPSRFSVSELNAMRLREVSYPVVHPFMTAAHLINSEG